MALPFIAGLALGALGASTRATYLPPTFSQLWKSESVILF